MADMTVTTGVGHAPTSQAKTALITALDSVRDQIATAAAGVSEVQRVTITGTPTGGTFTLTLSGQTTAAIARNADAATVALAVAALSNVGTGNVTGSGGALPGTAVDLTFAKSLGNLAQMTATGSFTGGTTPAVAVTTVTTGELPAFSDTVKAQLQGRVVDLAEDIASELRGHTTA